MAQKTMTPPSGEYGYRSNTQQWRLPLLIGLFIIAGLVIGTTVFTSSEETVVEDSGSSFILGDGMAMQYAQPWLDNQGTVVAPPAQISNAMAMQYIEPWLAASPVSNALAMQYAQPWLEMTASAAPSTLLSDSMAMQYAQPWLEMSGNSAPASAEGQFSDALALQYARPWLEMIENEMMSAN